MAIAHNTKTVATVILLIDDSSNGEHAELPRVAREMSKRRATRE
jgi:hypothetical protein